MSVPKIRAGNTRILAEGFLGTGLNFLGILNALDAQAWREKRITKALNALADLMSKRSPASYVNKGS